MNNQNIRVSLIVSLVHAFMGKIDSRIRGIQIKIDGVVIEITCYFDNEITEVNLEEISDIESDIISDFCTPYNQTVVRCKSIRLDFPSPLPWDAFTKWFYLKKEDWIDSTL